MSIFFEPATVIIPVWPSYHKEKPVRVCGSTAHLLTVAINFINEGNSVWCGGHRLIVFSRCCTWCMFVHFASRLLLGWLIETWKVNVVWSFWLLWRQGMQQGFPRYFTYGCRGVRAFQKAKSCCVESWNGCIAIASKLLTTDGLVSTA